MTLIRTAPLALVLGLSVACSGDKDNDGDGLTNAEEKELGTDKEVADSDGDGYSDGDEVQAGSDPTSAADVIYEGGWPYNGAKADIADPGLSGHPAVGDVVGNFTYVDQFGQEVDLYDFAGQGKYVMVDVSAEWCPPCRMMAYWMTGVDPDTYDFSQDLVFRSAAQQQGGQAYYNGVADFVRSMDSDYGVIADAVHNGDVYWVTVIYQDWYGDPTTPDAIERWSTTFDDPNVPVVNGGDGKVAEYYNLEFFPSVYLLDSDMKLVKGPSAQSWEPPLQFLVDEL